MAAVALPPREPYFRRFCLDMLAHPLHLLIRDIRACQHTLIGRVRQILPPIDTNRLLRIRHHCRCLRMCNWHRWRWSCGHLRLRRGRGLRDCEERDGGKKDVVCGWEMHGGIGVVGEDLAEFVD